MNHFHGILGLFVSFLIVPGVDPAIGRAAEQGPAAPGATAPASKGDAARRLQGTWKLIGIEEFNAQGQAVTPLDYGPEPVGLLMYDASGNMSVQVMRRGRPRLDSDDVHRATLEQAKSSMVGYNAYFGTYEVRESQSLVIHHLVGCLIPNWEGSQQQRRFTFSGDKLILDVPEFQAAGEKRTRRVTWQRVP